MKWLFELLDRMSGPATSIAKSVAGANTSMKAAAPAAASMSAAMDKTTISTEKAVTATEKLAPAITKTNTAMGLTIAQHAAIATSLGRFAQGVQEASLTLEQHTKIAQSLGSFFGNLGTLPDKAKPKVKALTLEMGNLFHSFAGLRREADGRWVLNLAEGFETVLGVVQRLGGALYGVASSAIKVGAAGEKTSKAFKLNLGEGGGADVLTYLRQVSDASRGLYTQEQLRAQVLPAAREGYGLKDIKHILPAALSVEARGGNSQEAINALVGVRSHQQITGGTLDALGFGSREDKVRIAKKLGGFGAKRNPEEALGYIQQLVSISPQKAEKVYQTLLNELQAREKGKKLGGDAAEAQNSPAATLARLNNLPTILSEKLAANGQLDGLYQALNGFVEVLTGPKGKGFIDALAHIIDNFANLVVKVTGYLGDEEDLKASGPRALSNSSLDKRYELASRALKDPNFTRESAPRYGLSDEVIDKLAQKQALADVRTNKAQAANAGVGTVLQLGAGDDARKFGYDFGMGFAEFQAASKASPAAISKSADDFIWRDGIAIEINPNDTVVGYKRGGSLGAGEGGGSGGMAYHVHPGAIQIDGAGKDAGEIADEVLARLKEAPGTLLLSAMEQFRAELGA